MDDDQQFCLRWNNHQSTLISVFDTLLENGTLVDCTLAAEGKFLKAHKVVLCACSPYFASLLSQQYDKHPIFILKDVKFQELRAMMDYMYRGEVNISQDQLAALLKAAESLQIKGLSDNRSAAKGVDSAQQKQSQVPVSGGAAGSAAKTGLTIEQNKRLRVAADAELSGSREGSTSPSSRKRKKVRRRSVDTNNAVAIDNHDQMSNSSSQSATQQQAQPLTSTPLTLSQITTATSAANVLNVTKKTDNNSNDDDDEEEQTIVRHKTRNTDGSNKDKIDSELLIEPKSEFEDGNDEPVEDLTMGDEDLMEDLEQAGPSHGGEGSSQGYQWQVDRSQDEVYLATQESSGQHRDAQEQKIINKKLKTITGSVVATAKMPIISVGSNAITTLTPTSISTPIQISTAKEVNLPTKVNNIVIAATNASFSANNILSIDTIKSVAHQQQQQQQQQSTSHSNAFNTDNSSAIAQSSSSNTLSSTILTAPSNMTLTNNNQSYQLLFTTVPKVSHPRIKYSGLKKGDDVTPLLVEAVQIPASSNLTANTASILDISAITPIMATPLQPLSTITIPAAQKSSQIINISSSELSPAIKYADIDDIELPDGTKIGYPTDSELKRLQQQQSIQSESLNDSSSYQSNIAEKYSILAATALKNFDISINDSSATLNQSNGSSIITNNGSMSEMRSVMVSGTNNTSSAEDDMQDELFACRHCGKKYRWKSTLRRHENDECGDKEPSHQCPYCPYKAKQRGNLGVHVRKHHAHMPQLESRRKRKA